MKKMMLLCATTLAGIAMAAEIETANKATVVEITTAGTTPVLMAVPAVDLSVTGASTSATLGKIIAPSEGGTIYLYDATAKAYAVFTVPQGATAWTQLETINAADGTDYSGTVTVTTTVDAGTPFWYAPASSKASVKIAGQLGTAGTPPGSLAAGTYLVGASEAVADLKTKITIDTGLTATVQVPTYNGTTATTKTYYVNGTTWSAYSGTDGFGDPTEVTDPIQLKAGCAVWVVVTAVPAN